MIFPYFQFGCTLEINAQRTAAYLSNLGAVCDDGDFRGSVSMTCDCPPLRWVAPETILDPMVGVSYVDPITDQAPWYDPDIPESGQFFGFLIQEVTQNSVASRTAVTRVSSSGGGVLGPVRNKERRLDFTVIMFGCNELAMEYGFRYLMDTLGSGGCDDPCTLCDAEYRDSCPPLPYGPSYEALDRGRWILKNVGMVEGPKLGKAPVEGEWASPPRPSRPTRAWYDHYPDAV